MADTEAGGRGVWLVVGGGVLLAGVIAVLLLAGGGKEARVSGAVTLDGQPLSTAQITFIGEDEKNASPVVALSEPDGKYRLLGNQGGGVPVGKYRVVVTRMALRDGTIPDARHLQDARNRGLLVNSVPPVYEDRGTTPLQFDLRGGAQTVDLALKKQP
ncbi:MAG: hypothetical protein U0736_09800 [Gemmataceae bacterium]